MLPEVKDAPEERTDLCSTAAGNPGGLTSDPLFTLKICCAASFSLKRKLLLTRWPWFGQTPG